jgi:hypothetical protein
VTVPQRPPQLRDSKSNLYEAALQVVKAQEQAAAQAPRRPDAIRRPAGLVILLLLALIGALLLLLRPVWLAGPSAPPKEPPGVEAATLRLELLRERQRVFRYSSEHGRLPATLAETGSRRADFQYAPSVDGFSLSGRAGDSLITLRSTDSLPTFLGQSLQRFRRGGTP